MLNKTESIVVTFLSQDSGWKEAINAPFLILGILEKIWQKTRRRVAQRLRAVSGEGQKTRLLPNSDDHRMWEILAISILASRDILVPWLQPR